jgi:hypothetical protein
MSFEHKEMPFFLFIDIELVSLPINVFLFDDKVFVYLKIAYFLFEFAVFKLLEVEYEDCVKLL